MELRHLEIFCTVIEEGSFSKAAETLRLTQPTVSIHIKALEDSLSVKLIDRMGRRIQPTEAGHILYNYASEIVKLKSYALAAIDDYTGNIKGTLNIAASTIPGEYILPQILSDFKTEFASVVPVLKIGDSKEVIDMVMEGRVDIGVVGEGIKDKTLSSTVFTEDELILVAPRMMKLKSTHKDDLKSLPLIVRAPGSGSRATVEKLLSKMGLSIDKMNICAELGSTQATVEALKSAMGVAFISRLAVDGYIKSGELNEVPLQGLPIKRKLHLITNNMRTQSPITKTFLTFVKSYK